MKCGINGAEHDFNAIPCGINGAVRQASELWIGVNGATKKVWPTFPVGTVIILDTVGSGSWECPASGQWEIEVHGGGGGGGGGAGNPAYTGDYGGGGGGGGGSGTVVIAALVSKTTYEFVIGAGGDGGNAYNKGKDGSQSSFANLLTCSGGFGGSPGESGSMFWPGTGGAGGNKSGDLASAGTDGHYATPGEGGLGNAANPSQSYGNGGGGGEGDGRGGTKGNPGKDGAIILTYLG